MASIDLECTTGKQLQAILGVSHQTIARLQKDGILTSIGAGKFTLATAVQAYIVYVADGRTGSKAAEQKQAVVGEQHRRLKMANDLRERQTIPLAEAELISDQAMLTFRSNLEGIAGRLSAELAGISDAALVKGRLTDEHRRVLQTCSDTFARLGAAAETNGTNGATAAEADSGSVGQRSPRPTTRKRGTGTVSK